FTFVAILTLALGIGANSAIFSVVNAVLLRPLPFFEPENLMILRETLPQGGEGSVSVPNLKDWQEQNDVFTDIVAYQNADFSLQGTEHPERISGAMVSANFFDVLGVPPRLGRGLIAGEDQPGSHRVAILSDQLWQRNFAGDPNIVGRDILVGGENFTVVGVMPPGFHFPSRLTEMWVPLAIPPNLVTNRGSHWLATIGRLKPGVTVEQAQEQMSIIGRRLEEQYPNEQTGRNIKLTPLQEGMVQNIRPALLVLLGAVGFVLLIACVNVANLLLARAAARRREIAIRSAVGAGRGRLVRQFLTESVLLSFLGGALGLLLGKWGVDILVKLAVGILPRANEVGLDGRVVGFTLALSLLTGIIFGLAPALQVSRMDVQEALKEGGNAGNSPRRNWLRGALVVAEVSSALVLLIGAGLMIKSFARLQEVDTGMRPENVLTLRVTLPPAKYKTPQANVAFYEQVLERVSALPGVQAAGAINLLPIQQWGTNGEIQIEGQEPTPAGQSPLVEFRTATPDYFRALGIPLMAGRFFNAQDQENSDPVVIVNQTLARQLIPDGQPLGKRILGAGPKGLAIVGVVGDVKQSGLTQNVRPEIFVPHTQELWPGMTQNMSLVVRAASDPTKLTPAIRQAVLAVDPNQPIYDAQTMEEVIASSTSRSRLNMLLLGIFAGVAMILAMIGIYSVMSYTVTQSTREIGIRMALGAQAGHVLRMVVGYGLMLALIGVALGAAAAFGLTRLMESLLYGVTATDPLTFAGVSALLVGVSVLSCYLPARRALKVDPLVALRYE
ncbi:MAG TPA: ABC transporter permease, partial [Blastocatellia bacterium]|nr:ABC transporter permease [Blastocatellia bacterium]